MSFALRTPSGHSGHVTHAEYLNFTLRDGVTASVMEEEENIEDFFGGILYYRITDAIRIMFAHAFSGHFIF